MVDITGRKPLDHAGVFTGQTIYYRYEASNLSDLYGPFKVVRSFRDHEGSKLSIRDEEGNERPISLADDEDYGALCLYT